MLKMLVPVDGSDSSLRAVDFAVTKRDWYKDTVEIHLINVQAPMPFGSRVTSVIGHDAVDKYHREEGMAALKAAMQKLEAAGMPCVHHISVGDPAETIAAFAKERSFDQIIMGKRGVGTATGLLVGSVATKVVHLSDVPVLLVK
jgi:nucleotide-binding universal stress UspA family protein